MASRLAAPVRTALAMGGFAILAAHGSAWDSSTGNPTHPTHSYLTEWAIDQLKTEAPEVRQYRKQIVEGANAELHETPLKGRPAKYGVDLEAKRTEHKGTNEGSDDIQGWWADSAAAYERGSKEQAYYLLGVMLHMVQDMGVPSHANKVYHQGSATQFDHFEFMALWNWKPSFSDIDRADPAYKEPWRYYEFSRDWTRADAPDYRSRDRFSKTWTFASRRERTLLRNREGRTCHVTLWTLRSAAKLFGPPARNGADGSGPVTRA